MEEPINVEQLCTRLVLDYVHFNDTQSYEELARLFAEDGVFVRPNGESINGRDAILHSYRSRRPLSADRTGVRPSAPV